MSGNLPHVIMDVLQMFILLTETLFIMAIITPTGVRTAGVASTHCGSFDGTNDHFNITNNTNVNYFNSNESCTMSIWCRPDTAELACLFSIDDDNGWHHNKYIYTDTTGIYGRCIGQGQIANVGYVAPYTGAWHHVVMTMDHSLSGSAGSGTTIVRLYIDGFLRSDSGKVSLSTITSNTDHGAIGMYHISNDSASGLAASGGSPGHYFDGLISEVSTWNCALNEGEVESIYNKGVPISLSSNSRDYKSASKLTAWWRFQNNANDSSGRGSAYNATTNGVTFQTTNLPGA